jgi:hypothetical protein
VLSDVRFTPERWGNRPELLWIAEDFGCCASVSPGILPTKIGAGAPALAIGKSGWVSLGALHDIAKSQYCM